MTPKQLGKDAVTMACFVGIIVVGLVLFKNHVLDREKPLPLIPALALVGLALLVFCAFLNGMSNVAAWRAGQLRDELKSWWRDSQY